jgi:Cys-tRNA(Pro)/Cys-tRNA(Cys) deacylase
LKKRAYGHVPELKKQFPTYIHETCLLYELIFVSAGQRGLQMKIAPKDLIEVAKAVTGSLIIQ